MNFVGVRALDSPINLNVGGPVNLLPPYNVNRLFTASVAELSRNSKNAARLANIVQYNNLDSLRRNYLKNLEISKNARDMLTGVRNNFSQRNSSNGNFLNFLFFI